MPAKKNAKTKSAPAVMSRTDISSIDALQAALGGDKELVLFFLMWLKKDRNATQAYMDLHPGTSYGVAATLGSRLLKKVDIGVILESYGIGVTRYFEDLKNGLDASSYESESYVTKNKKGEKVTKYRKVARPDWGTRSTYHGKLGSLLGFEGRGTVNNQQVNVFQATNIESIPENDLDAMLNR